MSHDGFRSNREYISHFQPLPVRVKAIKGQGQTERVSYDIRTIQYNDNKDVYSNKSTHQKTFSLK